MTAIACVDDILRLYAERGGFRYGEGVTQLDHAVQCATLAENEGATPELVVAALLHDIGHLAAHGQETPDFTADDRHEVAGGAILGRLFGEAVRAPVALHVAAKRYLCFADPTYRSTLSDASRHSLALQGGAFDEIAAAAFERHPHWREAVALRRFDDWGKRDDAAGRRFEDFVPLVRRLAADRGAG